VVRVAKAQTVPLDVAMTVYLRPTTPRAPTIAQLRALLGSRPLPDGRLGFFDPDNLDFGQGIASSQIIRLAQGVAGVQNVVVTRFQELGVPPPAGTVAVPAFIPIGPLEVARLDQDPNRPENGVLSLTVVGGR
jgi:hypothetical protein